MRRSVAAAALLLAVYVGLSFLNSPRGFLGTDTGGKVATLEVMVERGRFDPDLGYWAEAWDPEGRLHPLAYTAHTTSGTWVNVTTLPALWVGWHLYGLGGYRLALLVPMLGSVAAAFAGRALLRRLGSDERWAWAGFALLGLASPLTVYALDFWEHSLGVALMAWAVVLVVDAVAAGAGAACLWRFAGAGLLFGAAATMRTEALVYLAVGGVVGAVVTVLPFRERSGGRRPPERSRILGAVASGPVMLAAALLPLVANEVAERRVVGATVRGARVAGTAAGAADAPATRAAEAAVTTVALEGSPAGVLLGLLFVALLAFAAVRRDRAIATAAVGGAAAVFLLRAVGRGPGFVPGLAAAWVLPAAAAAARRRRRSGADEERPVDGRPAVVRLLVAISSGALPLVLATQFRGGAGPQWAGRYLLVSGFLLAVVGWAALRTRPRAVAAGFAGLAAAVTVFGLVWTSSRGHDVERAIATVERRPEPVIVSGVFHLAREGGATYGRKRWLTMTDRGGEEEVVRVLDGAGIDRFASVDLAGEGRRRFSGFEPGTVARERLFPGVDLDVTTWRRAP